MNGGGEFTIRASLYLNELTNFQTLNTEPLAIVKDYIWGIRYKCYTVIDENIDTLAAILKLIWI